MPNPIIETISVGGDVYDIADTTARTSASNAATAAGNAQTAANNAQGMIATVEAGSTASKNYSVGDLLVYNGTLYRVTEMISSGGALTVGTNITATTVARQLALVVNDNLLDNAYFVGGGSQQGGGQFPINQSGTTQITGIGYICDRWRQVFSSPTTTLTANGITASVVPRIVQEFEGGGTRFAGLPLTFSVLLRDAGVFSVSCASFDVTKCLYINATVPTASYADKASSLPYEVVEVRFPATDCLIAAKLEVGSTQTLAHQENGAWVLNSIPDYETELSKCKRYLQIIQPGYSAPVPVCGAAVTNAAGITVSVPVPVTMAKTPKITSTGSWTLRSGASTTGVSVTFPESAAAAYSGFVAMLLTPEGLSVGSYYNLMPAGNTVAATSSIIFDANPATT